MREIKFRVWHPDEKRMYIIHNRLYMGSSGFDDPFVGHERGEWMQYTGLKDRKGVEIYEHDIMRIKLPLGGFWGNVAKEKIGVVKYSEDFAGFIVEWEYSINQHHVRLDCDFAIEGEIFGNIHEHHHLLNTDK